MTRFEWLRSVVGWSKLAPISAPPTTSAPQSHRILDDVVFHAQQAAEKALKGFLSWHDRPFRKTHDLVEIGHACVEIDPSLEEVIRRAAPLTEYAWKFRYPGEPEEPTLDEADDAVGLARGVYDTVLSRLPAAVRPRRRSSDQQ